MEDPDNADIPEGAVRFNVTAEDIASAIAEESLEVPPAVAKVPFGSFDWQHAVHSIAA